MKRFYYDGRIAKILLPFSSCYTITIGLFVFSKLAEINITQRVRNHETCHSYQWIEVACLFGFVVLLLQLMFVISPWWYHVAAFAFYIWYVIEWLIKQVFYKNIKLAYKKVSFEQEAYASEYDCNYIENCPLLSRWLQYIRIND